MLIALLMLSVIISEPQERVSRSHGPNLTTYHRRISSVVESQSNLFEKWCNIGRHFVRLSGFAKAASKKDGLQTKCRGCHADYQRRNAVRLAKKARERRSANIEIHRARKHQYHLKNRERLNKKSSEYYWANREQTVEIRRERSRHYYKANREMLLAKGKERYWSNLDSERERKKRSNQREEAKVLARQAGKRFYRKHKAKVLAKAHRRRTAVGCFTSEQWLAKCAYWGWRCHLCLGELNAQSATVDHRIPLSKGGNNWLANLAPACGFCNKSRGNRDELQYRIYIRTLRATERGVSHAV